MRARFEPSEPMTSNLPPLPKRFCGVLMSEAFCLCENCGNRWKFEVAAAVQPGVSGQVPRRNPLAVPMKRDHKMEPVPPTVPQPSLPSTPRAFESQPQLSDEVGNTRWEQPFISSSHYQPPPPTHSPYSSQHLPPPFYTEAPKTQATPSTVDQERSEHNFDLGDEWATRPSLGIPTKEDLTLVRKVGNNPWGARGRRACDDCRKRNVKVLCII
jgi:hypothetical protein